MKNKLIRNAIAIGVLVLFPLIFSLIGDRIEGNGWNWGIGDVIFAFVFLFGATVVYEFITRKIVKKSNKILIGVGVFIIVFLIWIELAVDAISQFIQFIF